MTRYRILADNPGYKIGDDGSIWSRKNARWGLLKYWRRMAAPCDGAGYPTVRIAIDGRYVTLRIHELVLNAFVGPKPHASLEACHSDGNPANNHWRNLRWDTRRANVADAIAHGTWTQGANGR